MIWDSEECFIMGLDKFCWLKNGNATAFGTTVGYFG